MRADEEEEQPPLRVEVSRHACIPMLLESPPEGPANRAESLERKNQELQQSLSMLHAMMDSSSEAIVGNDSNGIITSWNAGAARIFGYTADEAIGAPITTLLAHGGVDKPAPTEPVPVEPTNDHPHRRQTKDGRLIAVSMALSPIIDLTGKIVGTWNVFHDLSEKRRAAKALLHSELRYRRLFESANDGILIVDAESGVVVDVNPSLTAMLGYSHEDFVGKAIWDLELFRGALANEENFTELKKLGHLRCDNLPLRAADGRQIEVEFIGNLYLVDGENIIHCNIRDLTARRHAEEAVRLLTADLEERVLQRTAELRATNKELEAFSYSVSHDLRAPLRAVDGFAQAVLEDYGPLLPEEGRRYLQTIRGGTQTMGRLIDDLLTFSRLGRAPLDKQEVDTDALIRGVLDEQRAEFAGRHIDVRIGALPASAADPALLKQVWINLLSNALKFSRRRELAVVEIGCDVNTRGAVYFIRDNGTGFDMRYANKLFGVFQRLHLQEDYEGTGVGLAIVQRIIHRHGGRIWAESALDRGTTFYFTLEPGSP